MTNIKLKIITQCIQLSFLVPQPVFVFTDLDVLEEHRPVCAPFLSVGLANTLVTGLRACIFSRNTTEAARPSQVACGGLDLL